MSRRLKIAVRLHPGADGTAADRRERARLIAAPSRLRARSRRRFGEPETSATAVKHFVRSGDVVLIKASRASHLERVGEALRGDKKK